MVLGWQMQARCYGAAKHAQLSEASSDGMQLCVGVKWYDSMAYNGVLWCIRVIVRLGMVCNSVTVIVHEGYETCAS